MTKHLLAFSSQKFLLARFFFRDATDNINRAIKLLKDSLVGNYFSNVLVRAAEHRQEYQPLVTISTLSFTFCQQLSAIFGGGISSLVFVLPSHIHKFGQPLIALRKASHSDYAPEILLRSSTEPVRRR